MAAWQQTGVVSGCAVTQQLVPNMSVAVSAGNVIISGVPVSVAQATKAVGAADNALPRIDLVVVHENGTIAVVPGTPEMRPTWPLIPEDAVVLATIVVPPSAGEIRNQEILDKRVMLREPYRQDAVFTTGSLSNGASEQGTIPLGIGFQLLAIATDRPARVRIYDRLAKRTADVTRSIGTPPSGDHGVLLEFVTDAGLLSATLSPEVIGHSMEALPDPDIPITVTNLSGTTATVATTLTFVGRT